MGSQGQFQPIAIILYFKCFFHTIALSTNPWVNNGVVVLLFFNMKAMNSLKQRNKVRLKKLDHAKSSITVSSICTTAKERKKLRRDYHCLKIFFYLNFYVNEVAIPISHLRKLKLREDMRLSCSCNTGTRTSAF